MARLSALVVEDDRDFRESLAILVEREDFEVFQASTIQDARKRLSNGCPDVVLIDLGLPDGDGLALLRDELAPASCEFVVITGNAASTPRSRRCGDGALDYLTKPVDRARLKTILANVARTRALKSEVADAARRAARARPLRAAGRPLSDDAARSTT